MLRKIEHLGIAVKSIDETLATFETLLGSSCYKIEEVASEGVKTAFLQIGESNKAQTAFSNLQFFQNYSLDIMTEPSSHCIFVE
jgi:hypothetical protein